MAEDIILPVQGNLRHAHVFSFWGIQINSRISPTPFFFFPFQGMLIEETSQGSSPEEMFPFHGHWPWSAMVLTHKYNLQRLLVVASHSHWDTLRGPKVKADKHTHIDSSSFQI